MGLKEEPSNDCHTARELKRADLGACSVQMEAGGGLLVRLDASRAGVPRTAAAVAARWFSQDIFSVPGLAEDAEDEAAHASAAAQPAAGTLIGPWTGWRTRWQDP